MTAIKCQCCGEQSDAESSKFDQTLGMICDDCCTGAVNGTETLRREGVSGIYLGPCGDNEKPEP